MRTSGVASENGLVLLALVVAVAMIVVLLGGPREMILILEGMLRAAVETVVSIVQQYR